MFKRMLDEIVAYKTPRIMSINYDNYWQYRKSYGSSGLKLRDLVIADLIQDSSTVLDLGCGTGRLLKYLIEKKNIKGLGIEFSDAALKVAKKNGVPVEKIDLNRTPLNLDTSYDYIVMSEIIEHIPNPEKLMNEICDYFKKSAIITIPNIGHLFYRLRLLTGKFPECWKWHPGEHIRFWTKQDFRFWLEREDNGFPSLQARRFIPGECMPNVSFLDSLFAFNYIVEVEKKNVKK